MNKKKARKPAKAAPAKPAGKPARSIRNYAVTKMMISGSY